MRSPVLIPVLILASATAQAGTRQQSKVLLSDDPREREFQEKWGYADAIVAGDTIYLSGSVASLRPGETDLKLAYERTFAELGTILKRVGASWDDVVDITTFHTDLTTQMPAIVAVKNKYVRSPPPAWTAIQVARLIPNAGLTEIKIVAKLPAGTRKP